MNEEKRFRFTKKERVIGEKRIETLFAKGKSFISYPFRVVFHEMECDKKPSLSILISIPKRRLKTAVDRNRMKRLTREVYRLNKHQFINRELLENKHVDVAFIYVADKLCEYATVEKGIQKAFRELSSRFLRGVESAENH